jgi:ABC-2 type transport system ATP-binding protein
LTAIVQYFYSFYSIPGRCKTLLEIENLNKSYGDRPVLRDLNLNIQPGEIYGLLGPNGAGKTTTINILCNLLNADSGNVFINGEPVSESTKFLIGVAPQENLLYKSLSCEENLNFFAQIYGLERKQRRYQVRHCLKAVNLTDRANSPVETLSGGMQRRLNIAVALVHQPKLVILDEPTTGHLLDEAERLCQKIGILKNGSIVAEGSLEELQKLIPAQEIIVVKTQEEAQVIARAQKYNFIPRRYGSDLAFWVPEHLELKEIILRFDGISIDSIARYPVRLEHIYVEVTK